jgi:hypothetical protein
MTKEQFLNGTPFYVGRKSYNGDSTYYCNNAECISKQSRSSIDERVVLDDYACNIIKIGTKGFTAFTYVMKKKVVVKYRFEDLVVFEETVGE